MDSSPAEIGHDRIQLGEIVHDSVRLVSGQLRARKISGCHGDRPRADRLAARDIVWCIPNHIDLGRGEIDRVLFARAPLGERPELVAIVMIVGEGAEFEKIPNTVVRKFQLRAAPQITSEQGEDVLRPRLQAREQLLHAREKFSLPQWQFPREEVDIEIEERRGHFLVHGNILLPQNLVDDAGVGLARDLHSAQVVGHAKLLLEHVLERLDTSTPGINQGAVDVEEEKALWN